MTEILFVTLSENVMLRQEVNGSLLLATKLLEADYQVDILRFGQIENWRKDYPVFIQQITDRILEIGPKCVSFYTLCSTYHIVLRIASQIRKRAPEIKLILGGPQATVTARQTLEAMDFIDYICTGEGEETVVSFFNALLKHEGKGLENVSGLFYRCDGQIVKTTPKVPLTDLETLPYWDDRLLLPEEGAKERWIGNKDYFMPIDTGRGCPYNCTYCSTSYFWNRTYRLKSADRIVSDMLYYKNKYGICSFDVAHDAFTVNQKLVSDVCDKIMEKELKVQWKCTTRIDCISKELILKMKQAGLRSISLGIETGSARMQKLINKRLNLDTVKPMIAFLLENDIKVTLFFMYGFPEETLEDLRATLNLCFELLDMGVHRVNMHFCLFDPCTDITVKNYDQLELDPEIKRLQTNIFGYLDEFEMIRENKFLFSFYYNLDTPIRREYQYLSYFVKVYQKQNALMRILRKQYCGDDLQFYKDFYSVNQDFFKNDLGQKTPRYSEYLAGNLVRFLNPPNAQQMLAVLEFSYDYFEVLTAPKDMSIEKEYAFSFIEHYKKIPMEQYSQAVSRLLLVKTNGKLDVRLLGIREA